MSFVQDPVEALNLKNKQKQTEEQTDTQTSSDCDQFNSFLFWREPPPPLDTELLELLVSSRRKHRPMISASCFGAILGLDWLTAEGPGCVTSSDWQL